jgi:hypothetical protein
VANEIRLGETTYPLGDLTGAHLEDHYDAVLAFTQMTGIPNRDQFSAALTLLHQSILAGGGSITREQVRSAIQFPDTARITDAVGKALGFKRAASPGEAERP